MGRVRQLRELLLCGLGLGLVAGAVGVGVGRLSGAAASDGPPPAALVTVTVSGPSVALRWPTSFDSPRWQVQRDGAVLQTRNARDLVRGAASTYELVLTDQPEGTHIYGLVAIDARGQESPAVEQVVAVGEPDGEAPPSPTWLQGFNELTAEREYVALHWGHGARAWDTKGWVIHRDGALIGFVREESSPGSPATENSSLTYEDGGAAPGDHFYEVRAEDNGGNLSPPRGTWVRGVGSGDHVAPVIGPVRGRMRGGRDVRELVLEWAPATDDVGLLGYLVVRDGAPVGFAPPDATSIVLPMAAGGSEIAPPPHLRNVLVSAIDTSQNATGVSPDFVDPDPPQPPTGASAKRAETGAVELTWGAGFDLAGLNGYTIHRDGRFVAWVQALTYTDPNPGPGEHRYEIRSQDHAGQYSEPLAVAVGG